MKVAGVIVPELWRRLFCQKGRSVRLRHTPASNVVGLKKADNTRIDPAQETEKSSRYKPEKILQHRPTLSALSAKIPVQGRR